ncbi:MAG TPA: prepilin peptidase, partial [Gammaproteobacteria bacterium]|nr:prepilin peptidase [Gammaproteobacteria bacterium]
PDQITLPLTWAGLLANLVGLFVDYEASLLGAVAGYLSLWSLYHLFRLLTGKEGMGYGDFKLLAAIGAWAGWAALPVTIVLSSVAGAAIGVAMIAIRRHEQGQPIPFGPFLAVAGWIAFLWGDELIRFYLRFSGLNG